MKPTQMDILSVAQAIAYLSKKYNIIHKSKDLEVKAVAILKLLFLTHRYILRQYGMKFIQGEFIVKKKGPVSELAYSIFQNKIPKLNGKYLEDFNNTLYLQGNKIIAYTNLKKDDYKYLSEVEIESLDKVLKVYGKLTEEELIELTHNFPEYKDNSENSIIPLKDFFKQTSYDKFLKDIDNEHLSLSYDFLTGNFD